MNIHLNHFYLYNPYGKTKAAKRKIPLSEKAAAVLSKRMANVKGDYLFQGRGEADAPIVKVNNTHTATVTRHTSGSMICVIHGRAGRLWLALIL
jgi:integrase